MPFSPRTYQFLVGVFASLGSFLFGYDLGVIGGSVASSSFETTFHKPSPNETGAIVSVFTGGGVFGAAFAGPLADRVGRRYTIMIGAIIFLIGGALQTSAQNISYLYAGRAVAGLGVGILIMIIPLYQAEIAHPAIRGRITGLQQFVLAIGACVATWVVYGTNKSFTSNDQWRIPLGLQMVPAGILAMLILLFPESPRWLIDHGKETQGLATLARLHANGNQDDAWVQTEYFQIQHAIESEHANAAKGYKELFTDRSSFRRLLLVTSLQASVQMTGVSAIQYFTPQIYATLGIGTTSALKFQGISNVLSLIATLFTILLSDRLGRRWPLIIGNTINGICFIIVTAAIATFPGASSSGKIARGWIFIVANWVYQISFSFTCGSLSWIIPSEVFDTKTRSMGVSLGVVVSLCFNTMIGQVTSPAIVAVGWKYFVTFIICNFVNAIWFWALMPETRKRPLEEMNNLFANTSWFVPTAKPPPIEASLTPDDEERKMEKGATQQVEAVY